MSWVQNSTIITIQSSASYAVSTLYCCTLKSHTMKNLIVPMFFSALTVFNASSALAEDVGFDKTYNLNAGTTLDLPVSLDAAGTYTVTVSSGTGDIDIRVFEPEGNVIGLADAVGDDSLTGDLRGGGSVYIFRMYMASCSNTFSGCTARIIISRQTDEVSETAISACEAIIGSEHPEYNEVTLRYLCVDALRSLGN